VLSGVDELGIVSSHVHIQKYPMLSELTWPVYMPSLAMKVWVSSLNR
jgi:hypothetical protein